MPSTPSLPTMPGATGAPGAAAAPAAAPAAPKAADTISFDEAKTVTVPKLFTNKSGQSYYVFKFADERCAIYTCKLPEAEADGKWSKGFPLIKEFPRWMTEGKRSPTGRHAFTTCKFWTADEPLLVSGLLGPVRLEVVWESRIFDFAGRK